MQVSFERSGGFAGIPMTLTLDTNTLPGDEAAQLQQLVENSQFFDLPATLSAPTTPDRFHYQITVQAGDRHHTVSVDEAAVPEALRPLLTWLTTAYKQSR